MLSKGSRCSHGHQAAVLEEEPRSLGHEPGELTQDRSDAGNTAPVASCAFPLPASAILESADHPAQLRGHGCGGHAAVRVRARTDHEPARLERHPPDRGRCRRSNLSPARLQDHHNRRRRQAATAVREEDQAYRRPQRGAEHAVSKPAGFHRRLHVRSGRRAAVLRRGRGRDSPAACRHDGHLLAQRGGR